MLQNFGAAFHRQIQIQKNNIRTGGVWIGVSSVEKICRRISVPHHVNVCVDLAAIECFTDKEDIRFAVFDDENVWNSPNCCITLGG